TRFIDVDALMTPVQPGKPANVEVPIGESLPASIGNGNGGAPAKAKPIDPDLVALLIDAYGSVKRDEKGYVSVSAMGQLAGNRSSFDVRN
ncbi:hypothetical protein, partial [Clostridium perfringens]